MSVFQELQKGASLLGKGVNRLLEVEETLTNKSLVKGLEQSNPEYLAELRSRAHDLIGEQDETTINKAIFELHRGDLERESMSARVQSGGFTETEKTAIDKAVSREADTHAIEAATRGR